MRQHHPPTMGSTANCYDCGANIPLDDSMEFQYCSLCMQIRAQDEADLLRDDILDREAVASAGRS